MSDVKSFFTGVVAGAVGFAASRIPRVGTFLGSALFTFGVGQLLQGIFGTPRPSHDEIQSNVGSPGASLVVCYGGGYRIGGKVRERW